MEEILKQIEVIEAMSLDTRTECFMQLQQVKKLKILMQSEVKNCIKPDVNQQSELLVAFLKAYKKVTELSEWNLMFINVFLRRNQ